MERTEAMKSIIWISLLAFCVAMTVYECYTITVYYFSYPVLHQRHNKYNYSLEFPAITLCSNNPANRLLFTQKSNRVLELLRYFEENSPLNRQLKLKLEPGVAIVNALHNLSESERLSVSTSLSSLDLKCSFGLQGCISRSKWYTFNSLYYGNCFTFNHGTEPGTGLKVNDLLEMIFSFTNELVERMDDLERKPTFIMEIHPYGTAPVLHPSRIIHLSPGDFTIVSMTQSVISRLPSPYLSKCVDSENESVKNTTVYYRPYKPYIYSADACTMTCVQRLRMEHCHCIDRTIPVSEHLLRTYADLPVCLYPASISSCYIELINTTKCNCPLPCKETKFHVMAHTESIANEEKIVSHYNQLIPLRFSLSHAAHNLTYKDAIRDNDKFRSLRSTVKIRFKSTVYEEIAELPKMTFTDFLGSIGGNVGLWLGMSVLSIFNAFEYVSLKIRSIYLIIKNKNTKVKPKIIINIKHLK